MEAARLSALQEAQRAVVEACQACDGRGFIATTASAHGCDGTEESCARTCPVAVEDQQQCEYCGRPVAAIQALIDTEQPKGPF